VAENSHPCRGTRYLPRRTPHTGYRPAQAARTAGPAARSRGCGGGAGTRLRLHPGRGRSGNVASRPRAALQRHLAAAAAHHFDKRAHLSKKGHSSIYRYGTESKWQSLREKVSQWKAVPSLTHKLRFPCTKPQHDRQDRYSNTEIVRSSWARGITPSLPLLSSYTRLHICSWLRRFLSATRSFFIAPYDSIRPGQTSNEPSYLWFFWSCFWFGGVFLSICFLGSLLWVCFF